MKTRDDRLGMLFVVVCLLLAGCAAKQLMLESPADYFAQAYSEMTGVYNALVNATTPTVPGAEPLMSLDAGRQVLKRLDAIKLGLDTAFAAKVLDINDAQTASASLRAVRALIPTGG